MEYFDIIYELVPEYMHNVCLGIVKLFLSNTFKERGYHYAHPDLMNEDLLATRVPDEFVNTRRFQVGAWKAQEFRNLLLFLFPIVTE
mgnify:CR=1 FL=1